MLARLVASGPHTRYRQCPPINPIKAHSLARRYCDVLTSRIDARHLDKLIVICDN
ncbi:MAG: hypothetical protein JWM36_3010 [Hyphomicrobiales bacterium]|nr:hypothetical protein [Hyphomicrobiales bacterium]